MILDRFGLLNLPVQPITFPKLRGAVLVSSAPSSSCAPDYDILGPIKFALPFALQKFYSGAPEALL